MHHPGRVPAVWKSEGLPLRRLQIEGGEFQWLAIRRLPARQQCPIGLASQKMGLKYPGTDMRWKANRDLPGMRLRRDLRPVSNHVQCRQHQILCDEEACSGTYARSVTQ